MMADSFGVLVGRWDRYGNGKGNGVARCQLDANTGELKLLAEGLAGVTVGAMYVNKARGLLYCVDERSDLPGFFKGGGGQVLAARIDASGSELVEIARVPSFGSSPCYITLDGSATKLVVTHHTERTPVTRVAQTRSGEWQIDLTYDSATTVLFDLDEQGRPSSPADIFVHQGDGGPLRRQTHPQLHCVVADPAGRFFAVCDKGNDLVQVFRLEAGRLVVAGAPFRAPAGSSPRYCAFHPFLPHVYVNYETRGIVSCLAIDAEGGLMHLQTLSALAEGETDDVETTKQSDLKVHPSGRWLYSLIRGTSSLAVFETGATGLTKIDNIALEGRGPRGCAITPDGRFIVIAAMEDGKVLVWRIADHGTLSPSGHSLSLPNAGCVEMI